MNARTAPWQRIGLAALAAVVAAGPSRAAQVVLPPTLGVPAAAESKPSPAYDQAFAALAAGDVSGALGMADGEYRGCTKIGNERWIDSIAGAAVVGECHYERGDFASAVAACDEALALAARHPDWLLAVQFPPQPPQPAGERTAAWGRSGRQALPGRLPAEVAIRWQPPDPQEVLKRGGVLAAPFDQRIRAQEIMRSLVIALYRRTEILGDLGRDSASLAAVAQALARRPAPPDHYSQAWIDVALGTALWAQGRPDQAAPLLEHGLVIGGGLDHLLTPWGLVVLGRIALESERAADAAALFEEATYAAADQGDARALDEAFRLAFAAHMLAGTKGVPATIRAAAAAIGPRDGLAMVRARLLAMQAEAAAAAGDARGAAAALAQIDPRWLRGDPGRSTVGAQAAYAAALAAFTAGDMAAGDADLGRALGLARAHSTRLFQTTRLVDSLAGGQGVADRRAEELLGRLLGPATPRDFGLAPLETLAVISTPRPKAFDAWIAVAERRALEQASDAMLDPAEAARRERWLVARPLGGRLVAAARLLAAGPDDLEPAAAARRAGVVAKSADLGPLLARLDATRARLAAAALAAGAPADGAIPRAAPGAAADWEALARDGAALSGQVALLAAGRDPVTIDFPPLLSSADIRGRLGPGQLILSFHWTDRGLTGVLESRDRFATWEVRQAAGLQAELADLARGLCLFNAEGAVATDKLAASDWRGPAGRIERLLFENSRVSLAEGIDELVIVPDGWLWYLPFELLPVSSAGPGAASSRARLLGDMCRIRYCPTRSLAVADARAAPAAGPVGVLGGRIVPGDAGPDVAGSVARVCAAVDRAVPVSLAAGGPPPALVASVFDALAVFAESTGAGAAPALVDSAQGRAGLSFAAWLSPPVKRPRVVLLPGFETALAGGLVARTVPPRPGDDIFLPVTDLLAAGARTAVVSRWRTGGATAVDLATEFLREATATGPEPPEPAAELWRRAIDLVTAECPDPRREPRLRQAGEAVLADARHPFFWAGYALIDCGAGPRRDQPAAADAAPR